HDDQAERIDRSKNGGAGADDDASSALPDLVPFIVTFTGGEMAVQHGDDGLAWARAETSLEAFYRLRSERDFRHQDDSALAFGQRVRDRLEIYFGFAAARNAMNKESAERRRRAIWTTRRAVDTRLANLIEARPDRRQCRLLGLIKRQRVGGQNVLVTIRIALGDFRCDRNQSAIFQASN